ncbi:protein KRI1 homolog [Hyalella azteca]|uniref:Protein KRI1 homolog n=1 Tax=Hyalella azteca TaxID=294128 RepID=A0A8B7PL60_HYAAZ|nr:protein KRI1 homolog [Hyalella azteca]
MSGKVLFSDDSDDENACNLKINKQYADKYEAYRRSEELKSLKELGKEVEKYDTDSSEISSSDELANPSSQSMEYVAQILEAVKSGKGKELARDPKFWKKNPLVTHQKKQVKKKIKSKTKKNGSGADEEPFTVENIQREYVEHMDQGAEDSEDENIPMEAPAILKQKICFDESDEDEELIKVPEETPQPVKVKKVKQPKKAELKERLSKALLKPNMTEDEKWMANYLLEQHKELECDDEAPCPGSDSDSDSSDDSDTEQPDDEEEQLNIRDTLAKFAAEAEPHRPTTYPYQLRGTARVRDTSTHDKKVAYAARRKLAKEEFMRREQEALRIKKDLLVQRLEAIKKTSGQQTLAFDDKELDEDFDPAEHDRKMALMYDHEDDAGTDVQKPKFEYDEYIGERSGVLHGRGDVLHGRGDVLHGRGDVLHGGILDVATSTHIEGPRIKEEKKRRRKKAGLVEALRRDKPVFDGTQHNFDEYFDEYYAGHCEDVIAGDIKCRFKYRTVEPNDYGLSFEDIVMAEGQELKRWNGLANILRYDRTQEQERRERAYFRRNRKSVKHMAKVFPSLYTYSPEEAEAEKGEKDEETKKMDKNFAKKMRKEKKKKEAAEEGGVATADNKSKCPDMAEQNQEEGVNKEQEGMTNDRLHSGERLNHGDGLKTGDAHVGNVSTDATNAPTSRPKHVTLSRPQTSVKARLDLDRRELDPLASSKTAQSSRLIVGDGLSTVLKLDASRLAAYSFSDPTRLQKFALYKEKMIELGHDPDQVIDMEKKRKRRRMEEKMEKRGGVVMCEQEREMKREEKKQKRRLAIQRQIEERKRLAALKKAQKSD